MKKLMIIMALVCCLALVGCGAENIKSTGESEQGSMEETEESIEFRLDESELEDDGYEKISAIAFVKIDDTEEKPKINIKYLYREPEISFYFMSKVMRELDFNCDFVITWDGEEYVISDETTDNLTEENLFEAFPEDWQELIKEIQSGNGIDNLITKGNADIIDESVEEFVSEYKKKQENRQEKEETENAREEKEESIIASKKYKVDGEDVGIVLSETEGIFDISVIGNAKDEEKASIMLACYKMCLDEIDLDKYSIAIMVNEGSVVYSVEDGENSIFGANKDGSLSFSSPDWIVTDFTMTEEEMNGFSDEIINTIKDFGESAGMDN